MQQKDLSDNALRFWLAFFLNEKSTLTFGGDHAEMEITPEARKALDQLMEIGAAAPIPPTDSWPGREYYGGTKMDLRGEMKKRGISPFDNCEEFITFRKKQTVQ